MIAGHRGAAGLAPENTLVAFRKGAEAGATWIEIDTQLSADLVPMIVHDKTVQRCSNGQGIVRELTQQQLQALDAGQWFDSAFIGEKIPTLAQALAECLKLNLGLNLEIKVHDEKEADLLVEKALDVVREYQFPLDKLIVSSFSIRALRACQRLYPECKRGFICETFMGNILDIVDGLELYSIHLDHKLVTPAQAYVITEAGLELNIWTLNDPRKYKKFKKLGVDKIITNFPDRFEQSIMSA